VLVEVSSPSTEAYDRGSKWVAYQTIPSPSNYVMIASDRRRVDHYQKRGDESWAMRVLTEGQCALALDARFAVGTLVRLTAL
jgi:Uma2 family endonuclease